MTRQYSTYTINESKSFPHRSVDSFVHREVRSCLEACHTEVAQQLRNNRKKFCHHFQPSARQQLHLCAALSLFSASKHNTKNGLSFVHCNDSYSPSKISIHEMQLQYSYMILVTGFDWTLEPPWLQACHITMENPVQWLETPANLQLNTTEKWYLAPNLPTSTNWSKTYIQSSEPQFRVDLHI